MTSESTTLRAAGFGLSGDYYRSDDIYAAELERIWRKGWLFAGLSCEVPQPGDYITLTIGSDPILLLRDDDGQLRAFHNICTHRGTVLCEEERGTVGKAIICPYHQWTFARSGKLMNSRGMQPGLDPASLGLRPVHTETVAGMAFISLASSPADFTPLRNTLGSAEPHGFSRGKVAKSIDYTIAANWKLVWENNRECYHCDAGHPQYIKANFDIAEGDRDTPETRSKLQAVLSKSEQYWQAEGLSIKHANLGLARFPDPADPNPFPVSATRTVQVEGWDTESMDGRRVAPFMGELRSPEVGVLRMRSVPNFWCHASCDHAVITQLLPAGRTATRARVIWLVDGAAEEGKDYQLDKLLPFWQLTSEQDWHLCELAQRGVSSHAYRPGPLSTVREYNVDAFIRWYLARLGRSHS